MTNPWAEYSHAELMSVQGVEIDTDLDQDDVDSDQDENLQDNECPNCTSGCNYCLMCDY